MPRRLVLSPTHLVERESARRTDGVASKVNWAWIMKPKRDLQTLALALFTVLFAVLAAGCETVRPHAFELLEDSGGGGRVN
jgi:hypothetical protein